MGPMRPGGGRPGGPVAGMMPGEKAKDLKGSLKKLMNLISRQKLAIVLVVLFAVGSTICSTVGPRIQG